jgi:hypothetical protein
VQSAGAGGVLNSLPVSLRYTLNGLDFLAAHEERYYPTVGSDDWGLNPFALIEQVFKDLGAQLSKHSAIISAADISFETTTGRGGHTVRSRWKRLYRRLLSLDLVPHIELIHGRGEIAIQQ